MLNKETDERILLIEGGTEHGKSRLLWEFSDRAKDRYPSQSRAEVDLKEGALIVDVLHSIYIQLGESACSKYKDVREKTLNAAVTISADLSGASLRDANEVSIGSNCNIIQSDFGPRLAEALLEDLSSHPGPAIIIIDTFEQGTEECQRWISNKLLPVMARNAELFCVVGGRTIPAQIQHSLWDRFAISITLSCDIPLDDWCEFASSRHPGFLRDEFAAVYSMLGQPRLCVVLEIIKGVAGKMSANQVQRVSL